MNTDFNKQNEQPKESWLFGLIVIAIVFALVKGCQGNTTTTEKKSDYYYTACSAAKEEVKKELKSPSSAKFDVCSDMDISNSGNTWTIKGEVEASNSFGVMIKNTYTVKIKIIDKNNYSVVSIDIK